MSWITAPSSTRQPAQAAPVADPFASLVDNFLDSRGFWRDACEDVRRAYEHWEDCEAPQRDLAFASYHAALDREDHAARVYWTWTNRLRATEG
jgi:hypothetical protein